MIRRTNRFHGQASLRRMQNNSQTVRSGVLSLKYVKNERRATYRLAIVVSKKVSKSAVTRNRIRRRLYECVRILSSNFTSPHDLVLIVYDEKIATLPADQLSLEVIKLLQKAKLTTPNSVSHDIVIPKENR